MINFKNEDEFLAHFCKEDETVTIKAIDLQRYMIDKNKLERKLKMQNKVIEDLKYKLDLKSAKIASLELDSFSTYTLDLSA